MGYDGSMDLKGTQEDCGWRFRNGMWHKNIWKATQDFWTFLPIRPVKLNFWALSYLGDLKDNIKETKHVNNNNNNNNNNSNRT